jgi:hypothetical protein
MPWGKEIVFSFREKRIKLPSPKGKKRLSYFGVKGNLEI